MTHAPPGAYRAITLGQGIRAAAGRVGNKPALRHAGRSLSYVELARRMARIANAGREGLNLTSGDRVALIAPNCLEYAEIVAGLSDIGAVVATISPRLTPRELDAILFDCTPKAAIVHPSCRDLISADARARLKVIELGAPYEDWLARARVEAALPAIPETAAFSLCYTSGTTGEAKGVMLSHRSRALTFLAMAGEYGCFGQDDHFLALAPFCHGAGFAFGCAILHFGGTCTILDAFDADEALTLLGNGAFSGVFVVPTHVHRLMEAGADARERGRGHRLRTIISNAAALPADLKARAVDYFGEGLLHETYGATEAGIITNIRPSELLRRPHSVGLPFAHMEIEIRDDNGAALGPGNIGEVFCRGPYAFNGYFNRPEETADTFRGDWITVGDMGARDEAGFLTLADRKKDMVISGGMNIYPREVELAISEIAGVAEVAVVGAPDREWGQSLRAFVVRAPGATLDADAVFAACRTHLSGYKIPRDIRFIEALPRNASGKVLKRELMN